MEKLIIIKTLAELSELAEYLKNKDFVSFDTETTGLDKESEIIGFSVCAEVDTAYYIILSYWDVETQRLAYLETKEGAKAFLASLCSKSLIMHNAVFDCDMVRNNFQVNLMPSVYADTMILGHLLNENRKNGLKELAVSIFGEDAKDEQIEMHKSVHKNGGQLTKKCYELYKGDADLIAKYGAKDTILTLKLFYHFIPQLMEEKLDSFFFDDESMPLLRGPTFDMNTTGLRVDPVKLQNLKGSLEAECEEARAYIYQEITPHVKDKYPGTSKVKTFNIGANQQLAWLLFDKLENEFVTLTDSGSLVCKYLGIKRPYAPGDKREFIRLCNEHKGEIFVKAGYFNPKTKKKLKNPQKIGDPWKYMSTGKNSLKNLAKKYKWVEKLLEHAKAKKLLNTYVVGIQSRMQNNVIRPSFLQHGTTSGRYSSRDPNFQNLPRDDKRVKACIVSRPGKVFVGADYSQLEPRVFASVSQDPTLMACFAKGEDFYSVVGAPIYGKTGCSMFKSAPDSFAVRFPKLRDNSKIIALATPYGRTAAQQAATMGITRDESRELIEAYFTAYPRVEAMMLESHELAKRDGVVYNLYGRPRRIPAAMDIPKGISHDDLDYSDRTLLNLAMNHRVQSTGASIMNRAAIAFYTRCQELAKSDTRWLEVKIVMQVHDELIVEGPEALADLIVAEMKDAMENTVILPGVDLVAEPKIANNLADLK